MKFRWKKHKYETQADLQRLSVEEIIRIDPKDVGFYIEEETGGNPLTGDKLKALNRLLSFKRSIPSGTPVPEKMIANFLNEDAEIGRVINQATNEIAKENRQQTINDLKMLDMQREVDSLNNRMPQPVTKDESMKRKHVNIGGRTRKVRKVRKTRKTRKARKSLRKSKKLKKSRRK